MNIMWFALNLFAGFLLGCVITIALTVDANVTAPGENSAPYLAFRLPCYALACTLLSMCLFFSPFAMGLLGIVYGALIAVGLKKLDRFTLGQSAGIALLCVICGVVAGAYITMVLGAKNDEVIFEHPPKTSFAEGFEWVNVLSSGVSTVLGATVGWRLRTPKRVNKVDH